MNRRARLLVLNALALAGLMLGPGGSAQEPAQPPPAAPPATGDTAPDVETVLEKGNIRTRVRLALPAMAQQQGMSAAARTAAGLLEKTLLADLEYSGVFDVQDQEILSVLELTGDRAQDFPMYRSLGNQVILLGELSEDNGRLVIEARVLDLENFGAICQGKRYRSAFDQVRRLAHTYANEVVSCFTGQPGIALTSVSFASNRSGHKEIFIMDYDGFDQRPLSGHQSISMAPAWTGRCTPWIWRPLDLLGGARDRPEEADRRGRSAQLHADLLARRTVGRLHSFAQGQRGDLQGEPPRR